MAANQEETPLTMASRLSTFMKNQADALEVMTKRLDREMKAVKNWRHFSSQLKVDVNVIERLKWYGDFSPTIRVFEHLEIVKPDLTIFQVKNTLLEIGRKDMSNLLDEVDGGQKACEAMTSTLLDDIALGLDMNGGVVGNWSKFALKLGIPKEDCRQFEIRILDDPTNQLFKYLETTRPELTLKELEDALRSDSMKRNNLANLLRDLEDLHLDGNTLVKYVITPESDLLRKISTGLNRNVVGTGNWRKLAYKLKVPREVYDQFETSEGQEKPSPTVEIMKWVVVNNPDIAISDVVEVLTNIQRMDVVEVITNAVGDLIDLTGEMGKLMTVNLDDSGSKQGHDKEDAAALPTGSSPTGSSPAGSSPAGSSPAGSSPAASIPAASIPAVSSSAGPSPAGPSPQVFISYKWDQQSTVEKLKKRLENNGIPCWMDIAEMGGGDSLRAEISDGIEKCKVFISCVTKEYPKSDFCQREATLAQERRKKIIPLLFEEIRPWPPVGKLAVVFTDLLYIRITTPNGAIIEPKFAELLEQVKKFIQS